MLISDLKLVHGEIINCDINDGTTIWRKVHSMVTINGDRIYLLQDKASGAKPNNFREVNTLYGTDFTKSWVLGYIDEQKDRTVTNIAKTGTIFTPIAFKEGEVYVNNIGQKFIVQKHLPNSNLVYFRDEKGKLSKMLDILTIRTYLKLEKDFKPLTKEDIDKNFYNEDLFKMMVFVDPYKGKSSTETNFPNFQQWLTGTEATNERPTLTPAEQVKDLKLKITSKYSAIYKYENKAIEYEVYAAETLPTEATLRKDYLDEANYLRRVTIPTKKMEIENLIITLKATCRANFIIIPNLDVLKKEVLKAISIELEGTIRVINNNIDNIDRRAALATLNNTRTDLAKARASYVVSLNARTASLTNVTRQIEELKAIIDDFETVQLATNTLTTTNETEVRTFQRPPHIPLPRDWRINGRLIETNPTNNGQ